MIGVQSVNTVEEDDLRRRRPGNLAAFEKRIYSECGEDGVIEEIFYRIGTGNKFAIEFGVSEGLECNTRYLKEFRGWNVLQMDAAYGNRNGIKRAFITAENVNDVFAEYGVPAEPDFLCIDIDFNDFWVWRAISGDYRPRLVMIEYNASIAPCHARVVPYEPEYTWQRDDYFGGSLLAMQYVAMKKGYELVYCCSEGVNAFFVRHDLVKAGNLIPKKPAEAYRPPAYGVYEDGLWLGYARSEREMIYLDKDLNVVK